MKIILVVLAVIIIAVLALGFLFVRWANQPENVAALQQERKDEAAKKIEDEKLKTELDKEFEIKKANLKLVIDEDLADGSFHSLDYRTDQSDQLKFEKNDAGKMEFTYSALTKKGNNEDQNFIFSKEDFGDFAAEMNIKIWGRDAQAGIFWDAQPNGDRAPAKYQAAYSSPNGLYVEAGKSEEFDLGSFLESATTQKLRVERFGRKLRVSVDDKILFDKIIDNAGQGKLGIYIGHRAGRSDQYESISIYVKDFKVWK